MNHRFNFLLAAIASLLLMPAVRADGPGDIAVYLAPNTSAPALLQAKANDPRLTNAKPAADAAKAAAGWETVDLAGPVLGYAPTNTSHKDFSVTPGTPIHQLPDPKSPVLGPAPASPTIAVKDVAVDWSTVDFPGPLTVYFQKAVVAAPAALAPVVAAVPAPAPTPAPAAIPMPATPVTSVAVVSAVPADPAESPRYFYGLLKQRVNPTIGGPINAQFLLMGDKGQIIALVELNNVILADPVVNYVNKPAKIYGTAYTEESLPYTVIHALSLQSN